MKKLLVVVDYQNDFVDGSLGFPKAKLLENKIAEKINTYREDDDEVVFTFDTHEENYLETQEGKNLPVPHCIRLTAGWELYGSIADSVQKDDKCFCKPCFGSKEFFEYLSKNEYSQIELVGVVTNICVISNAVLAKTALPEVPVVIDASCTASNDVTLHEKALDVLQSMQFQIINR
jgi:nicotinamidase-related amidase